MINNLCTYFFLLITLFSGSTISGTFQYGKEGPISLDKLILSPDKISSIALYISTEIEKEGVASKQWLKVSTIHNNWWIDLPIGENGKYGYVFSVEFVDNDNALIVFGNSMVLVTTILNLQSKQLFYISGGEGEYIKGGINSGLIMIKGEKGYLKGGGAYWFNMLLDKEGDIVEILSLPKTESDTCVPISDLLNMKMAHPKLRNTRDGCVYVLR